MYIKMDETIDHRNWFQRNWKWAVPTGGCLLIIILFIAFAGTMIMGVTSLFSDSDPYKEGVARAQSNQAVTAALGTPVETYGMTKGSINYKNGDGHTNLEIPIKGPNGKGILMVVADKYTETWEYSVMEVIVNDTGEKISLLEDTEALDEW
ncbi:cytochrome c oxidase assembly factor Coa1 family protein [Altibacter lentus]|uniref:cytochrome c oxidase assembly factor Coa1 family protein n=2 Tax=Altibacter TaxID=1535231 RepID=UPI001E313536|nr:cytochrome c oxidase assembly factor Coa1 family protein [Altibacter lentus]